MREEPGQPAVGVFDLAFERNAPVSVANERTVSMSSWRSNARAVINAYGFPLMVRIDAEVRSPGGRINYGADYEYDGDSFDATVTIDGLDADRNVNIPNHRRLDRDAPAGLFLFMPPSSVCLGANTTLEGWTGAKCDGRFATFANPGLFSLIMPTLYEGGTGEGEFLVLMPNRSGRARANERVLDAFRRRRTDVAAINRSSTLFERFSVKFEQGRFSVAVAACWSSPGSCPSHRTKSVSLPPCPLVRSNGRIHTSRLPQHRAFARRGTGHAQRIHGHR